ncbi:MAG: hypothetical protein GF329_16100 [Candidatus Lokiarchaeota archaeon]|nr:hypothetical protein [Candidatus Lokiarchaeota archaeon]
MIANSSMSKNPIKVSGVSLVRISFDETNYKKIRQELDKSLLKVVDEVDIFYKNGIKTALIQNIYELYKKEILEKRKGNSIIPFDQFIIYIIYNEIKTNEILLIIYIDEKKEQDQFSKIFIHSRKVIRKLKLDSNDKKVAEFCNKTIEIPKLNKTNGIYTIIQKESNDRIKSLYLILRRLNSKINARISSLINSDDGLEIASKFTGPSNISENNEVIEFLQYLSVKVITNSLEKAKQIFDKFEEHNFIENSDYDIVVWRLKKDIILFYKIHNKVSLLSIVPIEKISIDKCVKEMEKIRTDILNILKL